MWNNIARFVDTYDRFLITTHLNPDGDAIGSEAALRAFLEDRDKRVVIANSSPTPPNLAFLDPDSEIVVVSGENKHHLLDDVDAAFVLDVNNWEHVGVVSRSIQNAGVPLACIDHHQGASAEFADIMVDDTTAAATGLMIYDFIRAVGGRITRMIADAVYAALITDTGTFRFSNTDVRAFETAGELCELGIAPFEMHRRVFGSKSWGAGRLLGPVLSTIESTAGGRLAWIQASQGMMVSARASYDDTDGFIDLVRAIKGVELVLFFKEVAGGNVKVSLRSNGSVDAFAIAESFGGGGHKMAAGMRIDGPMENAIRTVVSACGQMNGIKDAPE